MTPSEAAEAGFVPVRPRKRNDDRTTTALRFDPEIHERLAKASDAFGLPMNFLVNYAVREFLDHMIDPAQFRLTRPAPHERTPDE